jgi:leucyl-tRNA synthetase
MRRLTWWKTRSHWTIEVATAQVEDQQVVLDLAKAEPNVKKYLEEGTLIKEIYVPGRVLNFVVK